MINNRFHKTVINVITAGLIALFVLASPVAYSDSTGAHPPKASALVPMRANVTTSPTTISNANFASLPVCPITPTNCPRMNGTGGNLSTCPNACTVTRSPVTVSSTTIDGTQYMNPTTSVTVAACPVGYSAYTMYNTQLEIAYSNTPMVISPVKMLADLNAFRSSGYFTCTDVGPILNPNMNNCHVEHNVGDYLDPSSDYPVNGSFVAHIVQVVDGSDCTCKGSCAVCSCDVASDPAHNYYYRLVQCSTASGGVYLTGNKVPVSVVCVRVYTNWTPQ